MVNIATIVTFSRILLIPFFIFVTSARPLLGAAIFAIASLTDLIDGYIARRARQVTKFGVLLDPIADKLLVVSALVLLVDMGLIPAWIAIVVIVREFLVTGLRIVALSRDIVIPAETGGKIKTVIQIVSVLLLLMSRAYIGVDFYSTGIVLLWVAMLIGVVSGVQYLILFWRRL